MDLRGLWIVFSLSFVVALSGALMPGPLLTYTIARTVGTPRRGWLVGPAVITGHAALEGAIVCGLLFGVLEFVRSPVAVRLIGTLGGAFLVWSGVAMVVALASGRVRVPVPIRAARRRVPVPIRAARRRVPIPIRAATPPEGDPSPPAGPLARLSPVLGGVVVSMSNPYWWVWWVTVGSASLVRFDLSFQRWESLLAFFLGHEAGDLSWYAAVSTLVHVGRRRIPRIAYDVLLAVCGVAITGFGLWLGISAYL